MERKLKNTKGITLIALVITIIILIILAGVSINLTIGEEGIITRAKEAKENMELAVNEENEKLAQLLEQIETNTELSKNNKANAPVLLTGMTPIKFTMPTEENMGAVETTTKTDSDWYEYGTTYETRRWANAQTEDGSMWVWIPRFAYKINNDTQTIDVVFLIGTTDSYYDEEGRLKTAQRQKETDEIIDTTKDFTVHPAFTDESDEKINYVNGGWDKELTGIWVAKFEAGYASSNGNSAPVKESKYNYSQSTVWVAGVERPRNEDGSTKGDGNESARNWLDGIYGSTVTAIKYPTFQGTTYSMNYINHNDSYNISKALTDSGNIYGFLNTNADSHLMKNSEWGAVAYLSQSIYGQAGREITINNVHLNSGGAARTETKGASGVDSVYAVTGCTSNTTNTGGKVATIDAINGVSGNTATNGIYVWNQLTGQNASTTGTIYGIYDLSGGTWERTSSYVANGNNNLKTYGKSIAYDENGSLKTTSTKYTTVYPHNTEYDKTSISNTEANLNTASQNNFASNTKIYGDAIRETTSDTAGTSNSGWNVSSWNSDYSNFAGLNSPFFIRGGGYWASSNAGTFAFHRSNGNSICFNGFRAVVVPSV